MMWRETVVVCGRQTIMGPGGKVIRSRRKPAYLAFAWTGDEEFKKRYATRDEAMRAVEGWLAKWKK